MGGGLLQLVAYGAQDAYLSGNPQITFWKGLYKRHTNFAMEPFRINLTGQPNWGIKQSAIIGRHADLLYSTYLEVVLPATTSTYNWLAPAVAYRLGYSMIKYVELDIGGQLIDRVYGEWLFLWDSLTSSASKTQDLVQMVGNSASGTSVDPSACGTQGRPVRPNVLYIPLAFFFTKNPGAALPLIALQYHEVKINIQWNTPEFFTYDPRDNNSTGVSVPSPAQASIYIDYIYLDVEERRRMAQQSHEYLIEQTQFNEDKGITSAQNRIDLTFNHPVKELVWVTQADWKTNCKITPRATGYLQPFIYDDIIYQAKLQINGQDRMDDRFGDYFNKVQRFQHHTGYGVTESYSQQFGQTGIYLYSFALRPEEHQPSGTCNFSRIDTATLVFSVNGNTQIDDASDRAYNVRVYAVNYNILRIMSGMAGLAYSN